MANDAATLPLTASSRNLTANRELAVFKPVLKADAFIHFDNIFAATTNVQCWTVGYDDNLYFVRGNVFYKQTDIANVGTRVTGFTWDSTTWGYPSNIFVLPSGGIVFTSIKGYVLRTTDITVVPSVIFQTATDGVDRKFYTMNGSVTIDSETEYILVGEYGQSANVRNLYFSDDGGATFTTIKTTGNTDGESNSHWHTAKYDATGGLIWASEGDNAANRGLHYSSDFGENWITIPTDYQPTLIIPMTDRVLFGRDENGEYPGLDQYVRESGVAVTANMDFRTDDTAPDYYPENPVVVSGDIAYVLFQPRADTTDICYIFKTDDGGATFDCVYASPSLITGLYKIGTRLIGRRGEIYNYDLAYTDELIW